MATVFRLFYVIFALVLINNEEAVSEEVLESETVKLLREQVTALLDHRQEDYNALEESLKQVIEKNSELAVIRNEVKQLRKEMNAVRGGSGNEAKNEKLRVRWLGNAVTELRNEVAEFLRTRNASEELAERSRMRSELTLLRGDVAEVGRGIRNLGGRIAKIEAALGIVRVDISTVKERATLLSRTCADITSQLSTVQIEIKSLKCETPREEETTNEIRKERFVDAGGATRHATGGGKQHPYFKFPNHSRSIEEHLKNLERKISLVSRKRATVEKRVVYENQDYLTDRMTSLETSQAEMSLRVSNVSAEIARIGSKLSDSIVRIFESTRSLEEKGKNERTETKHQLASLAVNAARRTAELSLTREELGNLRRAVQALSVSASKLQERADLQWNAVNFLNETLVRYARYVQFDEEETVLSPKPEERVLAAAAFISFFRKENWVVVARRTNGALNFDRTWHDYSVGFGSPFDEFWLGNEALHKLTRDNCTSLRIDLIDVYGVPWRAEYENFNVDSAEKGYRLRTSGYFGNATDALSYHEGMAFSAKDRDMDVSATDCAANYHGGWWFNRCQYANLNGEYSLGLTWYRSNVNHWMKIVSSEMSVRRKREC